MNIEQMQRALADRGLYPEDQIDGVWGNLTEKAWQALLAAFDAKRIPTAKRSLAWGARVSRIFSDRVVWIAEQLGMPEDGPNWIMACMAWESNETFSPSITNMAGSGATGLIQFMPATAASLGTSPAVLAAMSAEDQLNYVYKYFLPYKGRLQNLGDVYMAILWPAGIGKPDSYVLWDRGARPTTYRQNAGLDANKDGAITRFEAVAKVQDKLEKGLKAGNRGVLNG